MSTKQDTALEFKADEPLTAEAAIAGMQKAFHEFKKANDERLAEIEKKGKADPLLEGKVDKINAELSRLDELKAHLEKIETAISRTGGAGGANEAKSWDGKRNLSKAEGEHKAAFLRYLTQGGNDHELKAMSQNSNSDGGFWSHADLSGQIAQVMFETSPVRQFIGIQNTSRQALEGGYDGDEMAGGRVGETQERTETSTAHVGWWSIPVHTYYAEPKITQSLLDDSEMNLEQWLSNKVADKLARLEAADVVNGTSPLGCRGITSYAAGTGRGQIEQIVSGASGGFLASGGADCLVNMVGALKAAYRQNAVWFGGRLTMAAIRKLKDDQKQYLWQPSLQAGTPATLLGYNVAEFEDMPALGAASLSLGFGDLKRGYQLADRQGVQVIRDNVTQKGWVKFYTTKRVGGGVVLHEAIKLMKFST